MKESLEIFHVKESSHKPVVVEPLLEDLDGLLGEVAAALAAACRAAALVPRAPVGVLLRRGVLVRRGAGVALTLANCREREDTVHLGCYRIYNQQALYGGEQQLMEG